MESKQNQKSKQKRKQGKCSVIAILTNTESKTESEHEAVHNHTDECCCSNLDNTTTKKMKVSRLTPKNLSKKCVGGHVRCVKK